MISKTEVDSALNASQRSKLILNKKHEWSFLDEYTFTDFKKDSSSPSSTCQAEGIVRDGKKTSTARLYITQHDDLKKFSACLYKLDQNGNARSMIGIISLEVL